MVNFSCIVCLLSFACAHLNESMNYGDTGDIKDTRDTVLQ